MTFSLLQYAWYKAFEWSGRRRFKYLEEIKNNERKGKGPLEEIRLTRLKHILWHAFLNVPYYSEVFKNLNITPDDVRSIKDLTQLPILTKEIVRNNLSKFKAKNIPDSNVIPLHSGGSTGKPLSFYVDRELFERMEASFMRSLAWGGYQPGDRIVQLWGAPQDLRGIESFKNKIKCFFTGRYTFRAYKYSPETMEGWVEFLRKRKIEFIYGYASVLKYFSNYIKSNNLNVPRMKAIFTSAETLFPEARKLIEEVFDCKVYDQYGSREVISIASECEKGNMHITTDFVHVEFIKDDALPINPQPAVNKQPHKIIATSFANFATPFIRYDIGDYGIPREGFCECGRTFPLIEQVVGRISDNFITPEGNIIYGTYFVRQMYGIKGVQSYQFHQLNKDEINLYIVKDKDFSHETNRHLESIRKTIADEISPRMKLNILFKEDISPSLSGKHRYIISDVV